MLVFIHQQSGARGEDRHLAFFAEIAQRLKCPYLVIIADNTKTAPEMVGNVHRIPCGNSCREFSGWEAARLHLRDLANNFAGVVLSNDTLLRHHIIDRAKAESYLRAIKKAMAEPYAVMVGEVNTIPADPPYTKLCGIRTYVPTMFVFFNKQGYERVETFTPDVEYDRVFSETANSDSVLAAEYRDRGSNRYWEYLEKWLYLNSSGKRWYGHRKLTCENFNSLKLKYYSILLEHRISQQFVENGGYIFDTQHWIDRGPISTIMVYLKRIWLHLVRPR